MQKTLLILTLLLFLAIELVLLTRVLQAFTVVEIFREFLDPVSLLILADFAFFGAIVFLWMLSDGRRRRRSVWKWLPLFIVSPTAALLMYLLVRGPAGPAAPAAPPRTPA